MTIHVVQGERKQAANKSWVVSTWRISAGAARHAPDRVTFDLDANGILHVSAKDKATGKEQSIPSSRPPAA